MNAILGTAVLFTASVAAVTESFAVQENLEVEIGSERSVTQRLKTLRTAPEGVKAPFVDERLQPTEWRKYPYEL